ncbi:50S ribosomal protein 5, chloroplastic [Oryza brachyantha]|uniref:50S ribosomal protein 5, chloroplastic n=1 Tax=Oryza brachyantha TaxID=4533 RepID=UPI0003EA9948|nr:50S ribosomal protein 5, chloroplastic [Oryza brachyantha]
MALLLSPTVSFLAACPPRARALPAAAASLNVVSVHASRLQCKNLASLQNPLSASFTNKRPVSVHASAEAGAEEAGTDQPEEPKPAASIETMPLETKQKMIMEQRAKMKLAKKLRQRRRRLVQKRRLRKKGRWPPSKMKKLKNV